MFLDGFGAKITLFNAFLSEMLGKAGMRRDAAQEFCTTDKIYIPLNLKSRYFMFLSKLMYI